MTENTSIKHIVISGGGISGLVAYGALRETNKRGIWNINNIETIYGTSAGSIIGTMLALKFEWDVLDDYLIQRPWQNIVKLNMYNIIDSFHKRGVFDIKVIEDVFTPLFGALEIPISVSMLEFYEKTKIEMHFFSTEINEFVAVDLSYKTHPEWRMVDAIYASSCLPILFTPFCREDKYYVDGGIFLNYPLEPCSRLVEDKAEILGFCNRHNKAVNLVLNQESTLFDSIVLILQKTVKNIVMHKPVIEGVNQIELETHMISIYDIFNMVSSMEERERLIKKGVDTVETFFPALSTGNPVNL
jgi:NTE family protein